MPEEKRPLKVFLCHATADKPKVKEYHRALRRRGFQPWLDEIDLLPGQDWQFEIPQAIETSDAIIIFLSNESVDKAGYVQKEIKFALDKALEMPEGRIFIIPARLEACDVPNSLKKYHWVDLFAICNSLMTLTETKNPNTHSKSIIYDFLDNPEQFRTAKQTLHQQANNVVEKYNRLCKTAITVKAIQQGESKSRVNPPIAVAVIGLIGTLCAALIGILPQFLNLPTPSSTPTATLAPSATPYAGTLPSATPDAGTLPIEIIDPQGVTMRLVPAGEFTMGSDEYSGDEKPAHTVYLDDFYMDIYEVTNALYEECVENGPCTAPSSTSSFTRENYYGNPQFDNYPVINVNWEQAKTYCEWRGGVSTGSTTVRLPTEAEWEKAARGGLEGKRYPWGDDAPVCRDGATNGARFYDDDRCNGTDTAPVGSYAPNGYGLYDMAGNVLEWVADWYDAYPGNTISNSYYGTTYRVLRGGSPALAGLARVELQRLRLPARLGSQLGQPRRFQHRHWVSLPPLALILDFWLLRPKVVLVFCKGLPNRHKV